ncbi:hypothetical protein TCAL_08698 [Tigriopus californicus]|uniref:dolichyl-phosphate-mannose--protein mannosyltransferase n=1 Tax=Tigriopus californicus TaxID=6832 RepID=A0A553NE27_TIGCA|nr:protein O-mannosyl-transferase Tmtc3-like [Tigriopus californicus]TRY63668.1 hypothetical protein TCAL_08698 [Tigriopus californicus]
MKSSSVVTCLPFVNAKLLVKRSTEITSVDMNTSGATETNTILRKVPTPTPLGDSNNNNSNNKDLRLPNVTRRSITPDKRDSRRSRSSPFFRSEANSVGCQAWIDKRLPLIHSLLFLLCLSVYWNSLDGSFVFDDVTAIRDNRDLRPHVPWQNLFANDFWGTPMYKEHSHKSYRPLTVLTFRWNYALHGLNPMGYHLVNVILHGIVTLVFFNVARVLVLSSTVSLTAATLFALHPIHTEAVSGIVGRAELLSSFWYLMAFLSYTKAAGRSKRGQTYPVANGYSGNYFHSNNNNSFHHNYHSSSSSGTGSSGNTTTTTNNNNNSSNSSCAPKKPFPWSCQATSASWASFMWSLLFITIALLCKEQGITILAVCVIYELCITQRLLLSLPTSEFLTMRSVLKGGGGGAGGKFSPQTKASCQRICALVLTGLVLMVMRLKIMVQLPNFYTYDNPAATASAPTKQFTFGYLTALNAWLLLNPSHLCCDWTMGTVPLVTSLTDPRHLSTITLVLTLAGLIHRILKRDRCQKELPVVLALTVIPFLPASNLLFPVGFVVAERVLYLPSMGFSLLVAIGWHKCHKRLSTLRDSNGRKIFTLLWRLGLVFCLVSHAAKVWLRNLDWKDEYALFSSGLKVTDRNAKLFSNVGHALEKQERFGEALQYFHQAVMVQPDDIGAHINVGRTLNHMKRFQEAEVAYTKAKNLLPQSRTGETYYARVAPNHLNVFLNLATLISRNDSRLEEADLLYRQAISMRADYTQAYINRGDILIKLNRTREAQAVYEKALSFERGNPDLLYNMGVVMLNQNKISQALNYFDLALKEDPDHRQALMNSAILIQETGIRQLRRVAIERLMKIVGPDGPDTKDVNERVLFNLAMLHMDDGDLPSAESFFQKAIQAQPDFRSALFNYALLLSETGRAAQSGPLLHQLIHYHPDHVKGLILLGDLYVNHAGDLHKAEECYRTILKLEPNHVQGRHNLCVVLLEQDPNRLESLVKAKECLESVRESAPNEDYILKHLGIVEAKVESLTESIRLSEHHSHFPEMP